MVPAESVPSRPANVMVFGELLVKVLVALYTALTATPKGAAVKVTLLVPLVFGFNVPE